VVVDCAALPETLIESVLFGHEKGAFTGAEQSREGLIRQANGGTLFLDEVGELPLSMQRAFLRVLQEHRFRPVGSQKEQESDFRLVAATNRDLDSMAAQGKFRDDLLFRLRSFVIELPPLRERPEDVRELARWYLDRLCERNGITAKGFSPEFLKTLSAYPWPGNVREFVQALERTVAAAQWEPTLFPQHLPTHIRVRVAQDQVTHDPATEGRPAVPELPGMPKLQEFRETMYAHAEKQYLGDLMALTGNDIGDACRISGLSVSRLYALLKEHDIPRG
jgi:two-component system NtrC family response regulator